jgi:hypothetical protein
MLNYQLLLKNGESQYANRLIRSSQVKIDVKKVSNRLKINAVDVDSPSESCSNPFICASVAFATKF